MPLWLKKCSSPSGVWAIWKIEEPAPLLQRILVTTSNNTSCWKVCFPTSTPGKHILRYRQSLAARILAVLLLQEKYKDRTKNNIIFRYDKYGKPSLQNAGFYISLSHSDRLAAAILSKKKTAIDIQRIQKKILRVKEKFLGPSEKHVITRNVSIEKLFVYWCAKEVLYKLYGKKEIRFSENILIAPFVYRKNGKIRGRIVVNGKISSYLLHYRTLVTGKKKFMLVYRG